jgi:hypothetical protein
MQQFTKEGRLAIVDIASRYGLREESVEHMLVCVNNGGGTMAQFDCPELGGSGQWMRGGMIMVGDMFNHNLKATVDGLCNELSQLLNAQLIFPVVESGSVHSSTWWPNELGTPISSGSQNNSRYAVFSNRLVIDAAGKTTVYDTRDHQIGGVGQQQGGVESMSFTSQYGTLSVSSLPVISVDMAVDQKTLQQRSTTGKTLQQEPTTKAETTTISAKEKTEAAQAYADDKPAIVPSVEPKTTHITPPIAAEPVSEQRSVDDIVALIEKLAQLHKAGVLSDEEFSSKKTELLARL